jgi:tRNA(fMet)-specific endonuclease VapC
MLFVDTDVLIAALDRDARALEVLESAEADGEDLATTSINVGEVLRGAYRNPTTVGLVVQGLGAMTQVPFGPRAARRFGRLMSALDMLGRPMPEMDGLIAAIVLEEGGRLLTGNTRHFANVPGLPLVPYR